MGHGLHVQGGPWCGAVVVLWGEAGGGLVVGGAEGGVEGVVNAAADENRCLYSMALKTRGCHPVVEVRHQGLDGLVTGEKEQVLQRDAAVAERL